MGALLSRPEVEQRQHQGQQTSSIWSTLWSVFRRNANSTLISSVRSLRSKLTEFIEPDYGLLDELLSVGLLQRTEWALIGSERTVYQRNEQLLCHVLKKSEEDCRQLLIALEQTSQQHLINFIRQKGGGETSGCWPLSELQLRQINVNTPRLVELLDPNDDLLAQLFTRGSITWRQRDVIRETPITVDKNHKLLDVLSRRSATDFEQFLACLACCHQGHLVPVFQENGVLVVVDANLQETEVHDSDETESQIVSQFKALVVEHSQDSREQVLDKFRELSKALEPLELVVKLIAFSRRRSIGAYFLCTQLDALGRLEEMYTSGELQTTLEDIFTNLLHDSRTVLIKKLVWSQDDNRHCTQYLTALRGQLAGKRASASTNVETQQEDAGANECASPQPTSYTVVHGKDAPQLSTPAQRLSLARQWGPPPRVSSASGGGGRSRGVWPNW